jgi:hypothetical protein
MTAYPPNFFKTHRTAHDDYFTKTCVDKKILLAINHFNNDNRENACLEQQAPMETAPTVKSRLNVFNMKPKSNEKPLRKKVTKIDKIDLKDPMVIDEIKNSQT